VPFFSWSERGGGKTTSVHLLEEKNKGRGHLYSEGVTGRVPAKKTKKMSILYHFTARGKKRGSFGRQRQNRKRGGLIERWGKRGKKKKDWKWDFIESGRNSLFRRRRGRAHSIVIAK